MDGASLLTSAATYPSSTGGTQDSDGSLFEQQTTSAGSLPVRALFNLGAFQGADVRPNGLCLPDGLSLDSWRELGCQICFVANCSAWWLGDWLVYGEQTYSDRYKRALTKTPLDYKTLRNYAWVARKFPASRRQDTLSFGHHAEVAGLPGDEQDKWLARASKSRWSCSQLRRELRVDRKTVSRALSTSSRSLKIDVSTELHDRWRLAAEQQKCSVADWIITTLARVASDELRS